VKEGILKKPNGLDAASPEIPESDQIRARGLARLLSYALLDAEDLGCESATESIRSAIDSLRLAFNLAESDIVRGDRNFTN
jgi:hypothetical protein